MAARPLFISFTSLLRWLRDCPEIAEELDTGLFYLGRDRPHIFGEEDPFEVRNEFQSDKDRGDKVLGLIRLAIQRAELDGRVEWTPRPSWEGLNRLLERKGYRPLTYGGGAYYYPNVHLAVEEARVNLRVIG